MTLNSNTLTVSEVNLYIKNTFEADFLLNSLWVKGEISNFKLHSSGHIYMTLKDEGGVLKSVMFRTSASRLKFLPENGMKVLAHGRISVYERDGQYQLYVDALEPDGIGALYKAFEQMKDKLEKDGLFDTGHKKSIPKYPEKIAVVTSPTGAAVRDILNVLTRRYKLADITIYPVQVQGKEASGQIKRALEYINSCTDTDVIILGRGGGSIEDLWAFNEEVTARAIYESFIPIISAVGHETDFTISDFVSDMRAPTPSAAAELATPSQIEIKNQLNQYILRVNQAAIYNIKHRRTLCDNLKNRISSTTIINMYNQKRIYVDSLVKSMQHIATLKFSNAEKQYSNLLTELETLNPVTILKRGYSVLSGNGKVIRTVKDVNVDDEVDIKLSDGTVYAKVMKKEVQNG